MIEEKSIEAKSIERGSIENTGIADVRSLVNGVGALLNDSGGFDTRLTSDHWSMVIGQAAHDWSADIWVKQDDFTGF
jgi:hypothetical protein